MAIVEKNVLLQKESEILYPITKTDNILDLDDYLNYRYYNSIYKVIDPTTYTVDTTFLDILKQIPNYSIVVYPTSLNSGKDFTTNEIYNITQNYYNLVEIIKLNGKGAIIKIYSRTSNSLNGYFMTNARSDDNYINSFTFVGKTQWANLILANGWINADNNNSKLQYRRENDRVFLRGVVTNANYTTSKKIISTFPEGFRPINTTTVFSTGTLDTTSTEVHIRTDILADGTLRIDGGNRNKYTSIDWVSFDNVSFPLD